MVSSLAHIVALGSLELCDLIAGGSGIIPRYLFTQKLELAGILYYEGSSCANGFSKENYAP
jgi:hypothetical protein